MGETCKDYFITRSGQRAYINSPDPRHIHIEDIAHALSNQCRWNGHVREFYSVAQHSVHVSYLLDRPKLLKHALLHDAAEAYLGDVVKPLKRELPKYRLIEAVWEGVIRERFGMRSLTDEETRALGMADTVAAMTERRDLLRDYPLVTEYSGQRVTPQAHFRILPADPHQARLMFLRRWEEVRDGS